MTALLLATMLPGKVQADETIPIDDAAQVVMSQKATVKKNNSKAPVPISKPKKPGLDETHPLVYKVGTPVRLCWHGVQHLAHGASEATIKIGKKAEPYMPFLSLCSAVSNMATPFAAHFVSK